MGRGRGGRAQHQPLEHRRRRGRVRPRRGRCGRRGGGRGARRTAGLGRGQPAGPPRRAGGRRRRDHGAQGGTRPSAEPRGGQDPRRGHRRDHPGGADLQVLRRRGPASPGREGRFGAPRGRGGDCPRGPGRGRPDHALELPHRHPRLENRAGAELRQRRGAQAGRPDPGLRLGAGQDPRRCRPAQGRAEPGHRPRFDRRRAASGASGGRRHLLHRFRRHRPRHRGQVRRDPQEGAAGDGRQEPHGRAGRRRPGGCRAGLRQRRLLLDRPALHRLLAADRDRRYSRCLRRQADRGRGRPQGRRRARSRDPDRPGGRSEPARPEPDLRRPGRRGGLRGGRRRAPGARDRGLLPGPRRLPRRQQRHADQPGRDLRALCLGHQGR